MKRGIGFFILAVLILLFSISCDFKNEDNNSEENNSNDDIIDDNLNDDFVDEKYEKISELEKKKILSMHYKDSIFGCVSTCQNNLNFSRAINIIKQRPMFYDEVTFYLTEFSSANTYYIAAYYVGGVDLIYDIYVNENDVDLIFVNNLDEIPNYYNNKKFSFVLEVRDFIVKKDLFTGEEINYQTKVYLPLIHNIESDNNKDLNNNFDYWASKYFNINMNFFDWEGEYLISSYKKEFNDQINLTCNEMFFGLLYFTSLQGMNIYDNNGCKYIQLIDFGIDDSISLEKNFELNGIIKGYECDSFVDEFMKAVCAEEEVCNFENYERYIYIKYDDFLNILFKTINS